MSSRTDNVLVLPIELHPDSTAEDVANAIAEWIMRRFSNDIPVEVQVHGSKRNMRRGHVDQIAILLRGADLSQLPVPVLNESPEKAERGCVDELAITAVDATIQGLTFCKAELRVADIEYAVVARKGQTQITFSSVGIGRATLSVSAEALQKYIEPRARIIRGIELNVGEGGRIEAKGVLQLGPVPIRGQMAGTVGIRGRHAIVLEDVEIRAGRFGVPDAGRRAIVDAVNPLVDIKHEFCLPVDVTLDSVTTQANMVTINAHVDSFEQ